MQDFDDDEELVAGGQGRTADEMKSDAAIVAIILAIVIFAFVFCLAGCSALRRLDQIL